MSPNCWKTSLYNYFSYISGSRSLTYFGPLNTFPWGSVWPWGTWSSHVALKQQYSRINKGRTDSLSSSITTATQTDSQCMLVQTSCSGPVRCAVSHFHYSSQGDLWEWISILLAVPAVLHQVVLANQANPWIRHLPEEKLKFYQNRHLLCSTCSCSHLNITELYFCNNCHIIISLLSFITIKVWLLNNLTTFYKLDIATKKKINIYCSQTSDKLAEFRMFCLFSNWNIF